MPKLVRKSNVLFILAPVGCMYISCSELLLTHVLLSSSSGVRGTAVKLSSSFRAEEKVVFHTVYGEDGVLIATDVEAKSTNNIARMCGVLGVSFSMSTEDQRL